MWGKARVWYGGGCMALCIGVFVCAFVCACMYLYQPHTLTTNARPHVPLPTPTYPHVPIQPFPPTPPPTPHPHTHTSFEAMVSLAADLPPTWDGASLVQCWVHLLAAYHSGQLEQVGGGVGSGCLCRGGVL